MSLLGDLRQAGRQLAARPGFTLAAVIILAVGIGANAATFSLVNGAEIWMPLVVPPYEADTMPSDGSLVVMSAFTGVGRLRDGAWSRGDGPKTPSRRGVSGC